MNPFAILNPPTLPCDGCSAECCGPVPVTAAEYEAILDELSHWPKDKLQRMQTQSHDVTDFPDCCFLDKETHKCSVYKVRPRICRNFGNHPTLTCRYCPTSTNTVSDFEMTEMVNENLSDVAGTTGITIVWKRIIRDLRRRSKDS
jgi:Fe-S-cluster containining protein